MPKKKAKAVKVKDKDRAGRLVYQPVILGLEHGITFLNKIEERLKKTGLGKELF